MADYQAETRRAAQRYGLDPNIFERQIRQESNFDPHARSGAGAIGIAQIIPSTARAWGVDPTDPIASLDAAAKNMARYVHQFGSYRDALVAYNAGPGRVGGSLPAETQNYIRTILGGSNPSVGHVRAPDAPASSDSSPSSVAPQITDGGQAGDFTSLLSSLLEKPQQQAAPMPLAPPSFAAHPNLPAGFSPATSIAPVAPAQQDGVSQALGLVGALGGQGPTVGSPGAPGIAESVSAARENPGIAGTVTRERASGGFPGSRAYPVGTAGKVIGTPYAGTHTLGNWQSDNAIDIAVPVGTPMLALQDGVVVKVTKHPQGSGRFAGDQITIRGANGNEYFYAHGVADVKAGQKVSRGAQLGTTGSANGVAHLHFGQMRGDPRSHARA